MYVEWLTNSGECPIIEIRVSMIKMRKFAGNFNHSVIAEFESTMTLRMSIDLVVSLLEIIELLHELRFFL